MIFGWFNAKESKNFGAALADYYLSGMKFDQVKRSLKQNDKKQKEVLVQVVNRVVSFKEKEKLNIYKKAQLCNAFKWRLLEAGLERSHVDELTAWLVRGL
ncbi:hypothetical protein [Undibacterium luofuense]|uniref:Uncharacterized protein n=1 Tax=Undibacterium luofuense TaxID=2828733 RepID=A0A941DKD4_9BURK|nr:hypothetical protein [Undibacterium luofuense]MBR7781162.1 hypothetical protein [Undibacterium luofuense]